ncbi:MAG: hypothetical protein LBD15_03730 [Holosporales bacterium]|jgi:hypothetical protein|nr:hypothetical protein [Holosporales bacterium]
MEYIYTRRDLLKETEKYQYSPYHGREFIDAYYKQRKDFLGGLPSKEKRHDLAHLSGNTFAFLKEFSEHYDKIEVSPDCGFALFLKRFEVSKKIWTYTDENFRPLENAVNDNINLYILFSYCCYLAYIKTRHLSFLNSLIKSNDIITSRRDCYSGVDIEMLQKVIEKELECVQESERY